MKLTFIWLVLIALILFLGVSACSAQEQFNYGYKQAETKCEKEIKPKVFAEGYRKGFENLHPGSPTKLSGFPLIFYKIVVLGGFLNTIICLSFTWLNLLLRSRTLYEVLGKLFFALLGFVATIIVAMYFRVSAVVIDTLLIPSPTRLLVEIGYIFGVATFTYVFFETLFKLCFEGKKAPKFEAWLVAVISSLLSFFTPIIFTFFSQAPEITRYLGATLLVGILPGSLYWLGNAALSKDNRFSKVNVFPR